MAQPTTNDNSSAPNGGASPQDSAVGVCYVCDAFSTNWNNPRWDRCVHDLHIPQQAFTYEALKAAGILDDAGSPHSGDLTYNFLNRLFGPPSPEIVEKSGHGEAQSEGSDAEAPEPTSREFGQDEDPWGLFPTALCQDDVELDPLAEPGPPSSIGGEATTQASSPSEVAREGGEGYLDQSEYEGSSEDEGRLSQARPRRPLPQSLQGVSQARAKGKAVVKAEARNRKKQEEAEVSPALGSRGRPRRPRVNPGSKRQKPSVRASSEDTVGYLPPAALYKVIADSQNINIDALERLFPREQRADVKNRGDKVQEVWKCRLKLAIPATGRAFWAYNPEPCRQTYNRDGYIRHFLEWHLGTQRPVRGQKRREVLAQALGRCEAPVAARKKRRTSDGDSEDEPEAGPSRKRTRGD